MTGHHTPKTAEAGASLIELLVTVALVGLICGVAILQTDTLASELTNATDDLAGITRIARSYAISKTTPHRVIATDRTTVVIQYGGPCGDVAATWTAVPDEQFALPGEIELASTAWEVCFNTRGRTTDVHAIRVLEDDSYQDVSVLLGGSVRMGDVHRY